MILPNTVGANNRQSKVTQQQVDWIRSCAKNGISRQELSALIGLSVGRVGQIIRGVTWMKRTPGAQQYGE